MARLHRQTCLELFRASGRAFHGVGPFAFEALDNARQFKAGERGLQHPTRLAGNGLRAGGLCNRARPEHRHR